MAPLSAAISVTVPDTGALISTNAQITYDGLGRVLPGADTIDHVDVGLSNNADKLLRVRLANGLVKLCDAKRTEGPQACDK